MTIFEAAQNCEFPSNIRVSDRSEEIDIDALMDLLSTSYWASRRGRDIVLKSIQHSLCFSLFLEKRQIGFARVVTDYATFAYLCDVIIHEGYRGKGFGQHLIKHILAHPKISPLRRILLITKDAQPFYEKLGFHDLKKPEQYMDRIL